MLSSTYAKNIRIAGLTLVASMLITGTAHADDQKTVRTTEIRTVVNDGKGTPRDPEVIMRHCPGEMIDVSATDAAAKDKKDQARIKLCFNTKSKAETATRIEQVIADIDKNDMSPAVKAELKAKLTAKIAELRAGG